MSAIGRARTRDLVAGALVTAVALLTAALLVARREPAVRGEERFRGFLQGAPEATFTPCENLTAVKVSDRSGRTLSRIIERSSGPEPLYLEVRGRLGPPGTLVISDVRYAARETAGCRSRLEDVLVRALGNEPFWAVTVGPSEIRFEAPDVPPATFPSVAPRVSAGARVYDTRAGDGRSLRLSLREADCSDGMSDAYYALSATLQLDGQHFEGCAREGWR